MIAFENVVFGGHLYFEHKMCFEAKPTFNAYSNDQAVNSKTC